MYDTLWTNDTIWHNDTTHTQVFDTLWAYDTIPVLDTTTIYIYDTIHVIDTIHIYDTTYVSIHNAEAMPWKIGQSGLNIIAEMLKGKTARFEYSLYFRRGILVQSLTEGALPKSSPYNRQRFLP